jgi:hypothetical protein
MNRLLVVLRRSTGVYCGFNFARLRLYLAVFLSSCGV